MRDATEVIANCVEHDYNRTFHDTAVCILEDLRRAGYAVVDAERFRIARKGFVDLTEAWAELRMDTEKDQALHDRLVATSRVSAALLPEVTP